MHEYNERRAGVGKASSQGGTGDRGTDMENIGWGEKSGGDGERYTWARVMYCSHLRQALGASSAILWWCTRRYTQLCTVYYYPVCRRACRLLTWCVRTCVCTGCLIIRARYLHGVILREKLCRKTRALFPDYKVVIIKFNLTNGHRLLDGRTFVSRTSPSICSWSTEAAERHCSGSLTH